MAKLFIGIVSFALLGLLASGQSCNQYEIACNGCSKLGVCDGNGGYMFEMDCPANAKYCNSTTCTSVKPDGCPEAPQPLQLCIGDGKMPNPSNCRNYFTCAGGLVQSTTECGDGNYFDTFTLSCQKLKYLKNCATIKCSNAAVKVPHPVNNKYYGICQADLTPVIVSCPDNLKFSSYNDKCV